MIKCELRDVLCETYNGFGHHILSHGLNPKEYYDKYLKKENEGICKNENCNNLTHYVSTRLGYTEYCSPKCVINNKEIQKKIHIIKKERYGLKYGKIVSDKAKETMLKKYGQVHAMCCEDSKRKFRDTMMKKYGCEYSFQNSEIRQKYIDTLMKKYGVNCPAKDPTINKKIRQTMFDKYENKYPMNNLDSQEKKKQTVLEKYGIKCVSQVKEFIEKHKQTCLKRYGETSFTRTKQGRLNSRMNVIKNIEQQKLNGEPLTPFIGKLERICLNELQIFLNIKIERQKLIYGYFPDGFVSVLNIIFEFDENFHNNIINIQHDIRRNQDLISQGYRIIRIPEKSWFENKDNCINKIKEYVSKIQNNQPTESLMVC